MKESMRTLMDLQTIDLQVNKIDTEANELRAELERRKKHNEELRETITELENKHGALEQERRELEALVTDEWARVKDRQGKLMNVQTNREYQSLLKEIEDVKSANKQREDQIVSMMEEVESIKKTLSERQNQIVAEEKLLEEETAKVDGLIIKLGKEREEVVKHRMIAAGNVEKRYLRKYEMLRERRNGIAVVGVTKGVCKGCNMSIPPQLFNNLLKDDDLLSCPSCNRMIFHETGE